MTPSRVQAHSTKASSTLDESPPKETESVFAKILAVTQVDQEPQENRPAFFEEEEEEALVEIPPPQSPIILAPTCSVAKAVQPLNAELALFFEKLAAKLIIVHHAEDTHTTLILNHPDFESSVFYGTEIVIKEFSTAPKVFNVEIISNPQAILHIQKAQEQLLSHFARANFGFSLHRIETRLQQNQEREHSDQEQPEDEDS